MSEHSRWPQPIRESETPRCSELLRRIISEVLAAVVHRWATEGPRPTPQERSSLRPMDGRNAGVERPFSVFHFDRMANTRSGP